MLEEPIMEALEPARAAVADGLLSFPGCEVPPPEGAYDLRATLRLLALGAGVGPSLAGRGKKYAVFRINHWRAVRALVKQGKLDPDRTHQGLRQGEIRWVHCPGGAAG